MQLQHPLCDTPYLVLPSAYYLRNEVIRSQCSPAIIGNLVAAFNPFTSHISHVRIRLFVPVFVPAIQYSVQHHNPSFNSNMALLIQTRNCNLEDIQQRGSHTEGFLHPGSNPTFNVVTLHPRNAICARLRGIAVRKRGGAFNHSLHPSKLQERGRGFKFHVTTRGNGEAQRSLVRAGRRFLECRWLSSVLKASLSSFGLKIESNVAGGFFSRTIAKIPIFQNDSAGGGTTPRRRVKRDLTFQQSSSRHSMHLLRLHFNPNCGFRRNLELPTIQARHSSQSPKHEANQLAHLSHIGTILARNSSRAFSLMPPPLISRFPRTN